MKKQILPSLLGLALFAAVLVPPASAGTKEQLIQLQTTVQILQDNMAKMQQSFDERMGVMKDLITQQTDNVNKMTTTIQNLQKSLQQQGNDSSGKVDQVQGQIQSLHDSVDELKARMLKISKQLDDIHSAQQTVPAPAAATPPQNQAPPPDQLYSSALSDFNAGKNDLASQEFAQYLQFYGTTDLAGNAQFYLGEIDYRKGNYPAAVQDYNKVLDQYPGGNKAAAAQLKKGFALLESNQRDAGVKELRSLISRFPKSPEAVQARERLNRLGAAGAAPHGKIPRPSPSHR
jgi:tol-pal system protein YbgF